MRMPILMNMIGWEEEGYSLPFTRPLSQQGYHDSKAAQVRRRDLLVLQRFATIRHDSLTLKVRHPTPLIAYSGQVSSAYLVLTHLSPRQSNPDQSQCKYCVLDG